MRGYLNRRRKLYSPLPTPITIMYRASFRSRADSCDDIENCRQLSDIIWGCLTTIFAATWVSVHPNVPAPGQGWLKPTLRRLGMMLVAIIAPELVVFFAARQWAVAKEFSESALHPFLL